MHVQEAPLANAMHDFIIREAERRRSQNSWQVPCWWCCRHLLCSGTKALEREKALLCVHWRQGKGGVQNFWLPPKVEGSNGSCRKASYRVPAPSGAIRNLGQTLYRTTKCSCSLVDQMELAYIGPDLWTLLEKRARALNLNPPLCPPNVPGRALVPARRRRLRTWMVLLGSVPVSSDLAKISRLLVCSSSWHMGRNALIVLRKQPPNSWLGVLGKGKTDL